MFGKRFFSSSKIFKQRSLINRPERDVYIKNFRMPTCRDCLYYKGGSKDEDPFKISDWDKCLKYGEKNVVTGEIKHQYADFVRKQELQCGLSGKQFIHKKGESTLLTR
jgi:hypothetical protein